MSKRRVCFVTTELAPFTGGGIGTWLANTLTTYKDRPTQFEVLLCAANRPSPEAFAGHYPGIVLHYLDLENPDPEILKGRSLSQLDMDSHALWRSFLMMCTLERIELRTGPFDVIEFIDWCGTAYFSLNAKHLGRSFQNSVLSVRLHATESMLREYETRNWSAENLIIADLERQSLLDADAIIAHLAPISDAFCGHFAFSQRWRDKVHVNIPPIVVETPSQKTHPIDRSTTITFTSKFQSFKRPEIFARATARLLTENENYLGKIHFLAFDVNSGVREICEHSYPSSIKDRVQFGGPRDRAGREAIIQSSIAVFPGVFEAFCFAAYEASMVGATVLLNARNPGFGDNTPWLDGVNCIKFDGSSAGLLDTLQHLIKTPQSVAALRPVEAPATEAPYWDHVAPKTTAATSSPTLTAIVPHRYEDLLLHVTVDAILSADLDTELIIATEATAEPQSSPVLEAIEALRSEAPEHIAIIRRRAKVGVADLIAAGLEQSHRDIVAIVPAGFEPLTGFLEQAVEALMRSPDHDAVLPCYRIVAEADAKRIAHWLPLGATIHAGLVSNRMTPGCVVLRRSLLAEFSPNEILTANWIWDVLIRAAFAGRSFLITDEPSVQATSRVMDDYSANNEHQRRENLETLRRFLAISGSGARVCLNSLGDIELFASSGPSASSHWQYRAVTAEESYAELMRANSVRLALRTVRSVNKIAPWLRSLAMLVRQR